MVLRIKKVETILALGKIAPDAKPFIPVLFEVSHDSDPNVSKAALELIHRIDPTATESK